MPIKPREMERILLDDGWYPTNQVGSHKQYKHHNKKGKVTIPFHSGDLCIETEKSIRKQAGI